MWEELAQETYEVRFYLDDGTLVNTDGVVTLLSEELEATGTLVASRGQRWGPQVSLRSMQSQRRDPTYVR